MAGVPAVGGPGAPGVVAGVAGGAGAAPAAVAMDADARLLQEVLEQMQVRESALKKKEKKMKKSSSDGSSKSTKKKKKKKKSKKEKKDKKKYGIASSSSSSSSDKSSSGSDSSDDKFIRWRTDPKDRKRKLSQDQFLRFQTLRFKKRGDLLMFATKHPGALVAHFILQARQRAGLEVPKTLGNLMETDLASWVDRAGLKEVRDVREVQFLAKMITAIGNRRLPEAMDHLAMRIREVLFAKKEGQSWDKAAVLSLQPGQLGPASQIPDLGLVL